MADQLSLRGGTTAEHATFTGANKEVTVDTTKKTLVVNDGATVGGHPLMRENASNSALALGSAATPSLKFTGDTNTGIYSPGADQVAVATNGTGRLFIAADGKIGVGTASPTFAAGGGVQASFATFSSFRATSGSNTGTDFAASSDGKGYVYVRDNADLTLGTNNTERLRITSAGLVGIGTSSPGSLLELSSAATSAAGGVTVTNTNTAGYSSVQLKNTGASGRTYTLALGGNTSAFPGSVYLYDDTAGATRFLIDSSGRLGIGSTTPTTGKLTLVSDIDPGTTAAGIAVSLSGTGGGTATAQYGIRVTGGGYNNSTNVYGVHSALTQQNLSPTYGGYFSAAGTYIAMYGIYGEATNNDSNPANNVYAGYFKTNGSAGGTGGTNYGIRVENAATNGGTSYGAYLSTVAGASTVIPLRIDHAGSEKLRIDSSGRLLVGTSSDAQTSTVTVQGNSASTTGGAIVRMRIGTATPADGNTTGVIKFEDSGGGTGAEIEARRDGGTWSGSSKPSRLVFSTTADGASSPTERMRIDSSGRTGFGITPNAYGDDARITIQGTGVTRSIFSNINGIGSGTHITFGNGNGAVGSITTSGSATAYNTSSDYRLKENVTPVTDGITRLRQLKPSRFNFIADPDKTVDGFFAHEVQTIVPEAITGEKDAVDDEGNPEYQGIDQSKLVPLLTAALQEAIGEIESLKARVAALETK